MKWVSIVTTRKSNKELNRQRKALKEGRSNGRGQGYEPFIQVRRGDFPSRGLSSTLKVPQLGRSLHLLSQLEYEVAMHMLNCGVRDIREQFALRTDDNDTEFTSEYGRALGTVAIAEKMGIKHPAFSKSELKISTTDFVVNGLDNYIYAVYVRYEKDVPKIGTRQYELMQMQKIYWKQRGVRFRVVTERNVNKRHVKTLRWALSGVYNRNSEATEEYLEFMKNASQEHSLMKNMEKWRDGAVNALTRFKTAVFTGGIELDEREGDREMRTLYMPWKFRVTGETGRKDRLPKFLSN